MELVKPTLYLPHTQNSLRNLARFAKSAIYLASFLYLGPARHAAWRPAVYVGQNDELLHPYRFR